MSTATSYAQFGRGNGTIWYDDMNCLGFESGLSGCSSNGYGIHKCSSYHDAGVICRGKESKPNIVKLV